MFLYIPESQRIITVLNIKFFILYLSNFLTFYIISFALKKKPFQLQNKSNLFSFPTPDSAKDRLSGDRTRAERHGVGGAVGCRGRQPRWRRSWPWPCASTWRQRTARGSLPLLSISSSARSTSSIDPATKSTPLRKSILTGQLTSLRSLISMWVSTRRPTMRACTSWRGGRWRKSRRKLLVSSRRRWLG